MTKIKTKRILIITDSPWTDNNIGITLSNLLGGLKNESIAMIHTKPGYSTTKHCKVFFQITDFQLIKAFLNRNSIIGIKSLSKDVFDDNNDNDFKRFKLIKNILSTQNLYFPYFLRELLWLISHWKNKNLSEFLFDFRPDVVFYIGSPFLYMNNLVLHIKKLMNFRLITYFVDDVYSFKNFNLSPFFWLIRFFNRILIKRIVKASTYIYTISPKMKIEYDKNFFVSSKLLNKGGLFNNSIIPIEYNGNSIIKIVYAGNIYAGRLKTIFTIAEQIKKINKSNTTFEFNLYTNNLITQKNKNKFKHLGVKLMGYIPFEMISEVLSYADILLHVEGLDIKNKLLTRLSFSTKIVDFFSYRKLIFAVGWKKSASINYLAENDIALIATNNEEVLSQLDLIKNNVQLLNEYGDKSFNFGKKYHSLSRIRKNLYKDLFKS
jgi:hypothetical protein